MRFSFNNVTLSDDSNHKLYRHLDRLAEYLQDFYLSGRETHSEPTDDSIITLKKIKNHISFNVLDVATDSNITGYAVAVK